MKIERLYRDESGRILARLIRLLGDFDLAEEAMQEAFAAAVQQWPREGTPAHPRAWLLARAARARFCWSAETGALAPAALVRTAPRARVA